MTGKLLTRGMLAGILAGLIAFVFARVAGEPLVNIAIGFEDHARQLAGEAPEPELVSRAVQGTVGLLTGVLTYGAALGGLIALVSAFVQGRVGRASPRATAALVTLAGFVAVVLVPQVKYPANPPSIGEPETIGLRTAAYFGMILVSVIAVAASVGLQRQLRARLGDWNAALLATGAYGLAAAAAMIVLPVVNEVPVEFPADTLWRFRVVSLGLQAVLWAGTGLIFGALAERPWAARRMTEVAYSSPF